MRNVQRKLSYLLVTIFTPFFVIPAIAQGAGADVQVNLIMALMLGKAWKLPEEKIKQLQQNCVTKACRQNFHIDQEIKK